MKTIVMKMILLGQGGRGRGRGGWGGGMIAQEVAGEQAEEVEQRQWTNMHRNK